MGWGGWGQEGREGRGERGEKGQRGERGVKGGDVCKSYYVREFVVFDNLLGKHKHSNQYLNHQLDMI